MKKIYIVLFLLSFSLLTFGQEFSKNIGDARTAYSAGQLTDARFSMEQMLRDLDIVIGKEILKLLPLKMDAYPSNAKLDNVTGNGGGIGAGLYVHRSYGADPKLIELDIINNSPMINSVNAMLAMPFMGNSSDGKQKTVKIQGYKSILNKNEDSETGKLNYDLQIPLNNTLVTLKINDTTEPEILKFAGTIPLAKISQLAQ